MAKETWKDIKTIDFGWGSTDIRYSRSAVPVFLAQKQPVVYGWKGEGLSLQAVQTTLVTIHSLRLKVSNLKSSKKSISSENVKKYFVRYTMSDLDTKRKDSILVASRLSPIEEMKIKQTWSALSGWTYRFHSKQHPVHTMVR